MMQATTDPLTWIAAGVGLAFLCLGWMLYWASLQVLGGVLMGGVGLAVAHAACAVLGLDGGVAIAARVAGLLCGAVAGVLLSRLLHTVAFFAMGCAAGGGLAYALLSAMRRDGTPSWAQEDAVFAFGIPIAALVAGLLSAGISGFLVIVGTSILGATLLTDAMEWQPRWIVAGGVALAGIIVQTAAHRTAGRRRSNDDDE